VYGSAYKATPTATTPIPSLPHHHPRTLLKVCAPAPPNQQSVPGEHQPLGSQVVADAAGGVARRGANLVYGLFVYIGGHFQA